LISDTLFQDPPDEIRPLAVQADRYIFVVMLKNFAGFWQCRHRGDRLECLHRAVKLARLGFTAQVWTDEQSIRWVAGFAPPPARAVIYEPRVTHRDLSAYGIGPGLELFNLSDAEIATLIAEIESETDAAPVGSECDTESIAEAA